MTIIGHAKRPFKNARRANATAAAVGLKTR
jgi:hypothetical protein